MATNKPQRPPPPRGGAGGGGMGASGGGVMGISFRSIEEEDEEDLVSFTGKFDHVVEGKVKSHQKEKAEKEKAGESEKGAEGGKGGSKAPLERASSFPTSLETKPASSRRESFEEDKSSPTRKIGKQLSDYKEKFSGLKDRITDTISRKLEEFSAESPTQSPTPSPDREMPRPADSKSMAGTSLGQKDPLPIKAQTVSVVKSSAAKATKSTTSNKSAKRLGEESEFVEALEDNNGDEFMDVIEEHFGPEPLEDFSGMPSSSRGAAQPLPRKRILLDRTVKIKSSGAASAPVSMATLMHSRSAETLETEASESGQPLSLPRPSTLVPSGPQGGSSGSSPVLEHHPRALPFQLSAHQMIMAMAVVFVWLLLPLPSYLAGIMTGSMLTITFLQFYLWLMRPPKPRPALVITPLPQLPPLLPPDLRPSSNSSGEYKGWMNELMDYKPEDYHISQTHTVLVTLHGSSLRLQRPKTAVPRRAMWDEEIATSSFVHQRHLDVLGAKVWLAPTGLVPKRYWSKKYPIGVQLPSRQPQESSVDPVSPEEEDDFELVSKEKCVDTLFLFARTGREKEEWFRRLSAAAKGQVLPSHVAEVSRCLQIPPGRHRRSSSDPTFPQHRPPSPQDSSPCPTPGPSTHLRNASADLSSSTLDSLGSSLLWQGGEVLQFAHFMSRLMPAAQRPDSPQPSPPSSKRTTASEKEDIVLGGEVPGWLAEQQLVWFNTLAGRCLWDFMHSPLWASRITDKLQRKLSKIHVPYFMEEVKVTNIDPGCDIPVVRRAGHPYMDDRGLWVDLDMLYTGGLKMTIETKVNLMRLKKGNPEHANVTNVAEPHLRSPITDPDEEDSAESSTDEEEEAAPVTEEGASVMPGGASRKLLRYLDRITQSKYFQQATEIKYVRRAMEGVSNTPLILTVELRHLVGTLAINIPPPPSDRLWYGFRGNPKVSLVAKPKVGEREVTITHITEWIEKKLLTEFQRVIVLPNMDDLIVPTLMSGVPEDVTPPSEPLSMSASTTRRNSTGSTFNNSTDIAAGESSPGSGRKSPLTATANADPAKSQLTIPVTKGVSTASFSTAASASTTSLASHISSPNVASTSKSSSANVPKPV